MSKFLVVTASCFLIADSLSAFIEQALVLSSLPGAERVEESTASKTTIDFASLSDEIVQSGLFSSSPTPTGPVDEHGQSLAQLDAAKKIKLMGTVIGEGVSALAVVQNLATQHQVLYHLHERIPDIGEISEVRADAILLRNGAQEEVLELASPKFGSVFARPVAAAPTIPAVSKATHMTNQPLLGVTPPLRGADGRTPRTVLDHRDIATFAETFSHERNARFEPVSTDGKIEGLRVEFYQIGGLIDKLGLRYGDVVQRVNGISFHDANELSRQLRLLKDERSFSVDVVRNGEKGTMSYEIR